MTQILHIFKKDIRRHWPEILISLALLALYTNRALHPGISWSEPVFSSRPFYFLMVTGEYIAPALVIFWMFLVIRAVQGESLVGDRQWWTTKPYIWQKLLVAKVLFIVVFICVPLFHVQLFLLNHFRFPLLANLPAIFKAQLSLLVLLVCFVVLLASLTKNFGQLLLVLGALSLVLAISLIWASRTGSSSRMESTPSYIDLFLELLTWGGIIAVVAWQYARRRRWVSVGALVAIALLASGVNATFSSSEVAERKYTPVDPSAAPIRISIKLIEPSNEPKDFSRDPSDEVPISIPVAVSGVAPGSMVEVNAVKIYADSPEKSPWSRDWLYEHTEFWPEDQKKTLGYSVDRKEFEKIRDTPVHLRVELGLSEYRGIDSRDLQIVSRTFSDPALGTCRISPWDDSRLHCLFPTRTPEYLLRFDPQKSGCLDDDSETRGQADTVSYAFKSHDEMGFPEPELSPISDYDPWFSPVSLSKSSAKDSAKSRFVRLCPGTILTVSRPVLARQFRIQLDLPNTRLEDLAVSPLNLRLR